ncbi:hypothetical protein F4823DRAFT_632657 [Ustulina deusta]|nr:hypothetical protein F4823DRAFT_632657 [Ustulina deusta]
MKKIYKEVKEAGATVQPQEVPELLQIAGARQMASRQKLVEDTVKHSETAERSKPRYSCMCKRQASGNDYLAALNDINTEARIQVLLSLPGVNTFLHGDRMQHVIVRNIPLLRIIRLE